MDGDGWNHGGPAGGQVDGDGWDGWKHGGPAGRQVDGADGSTVVLLVNELMGIDGYTVGLRNRYGKDGSMMMLLRCWIRL